MGIYGLIDGSFNCIEARGILKSKKLLLTWAVMVCRGTHKYFQWDVKIVDLSSKKI